MNIRRFPLARLGVSWSVGGILEFTATGALLAALYQPLESAADD